MDRRQFLITTAGAAAAAAAGTAVGADESIAVEAGSGGGAGAPAVVARRVELPLVAAWRGAPVGLVDRADRLARGIEEASGGELRVLRIEAGGASPRESLGLGTEHARLPLHPAFAFFAGLPGSLGVAAVELEGWLSTGGGQALWDDLAADYGTKPILAGHAGAPAVLWSSTPIDGLDALAGRRVAMRGLALDVVRGLGAEGIPLDETAAPAGLESDPDLAVEWGGPLASSAMGLPRSRPYGLANMMGPAGTALSLNVPLDVWTRLSPTQQGAIGSAAAQEFRAALAEEDAQAALVATALDRRFRARIADTPRDIRLAVDRVAGVVVAHAAAFDRRAERINHSFMEWRRVSGARAPRDAQLGA